MLRNFLEAVFMLFFLSFILLLMCCAVCEPTFAENTVETPPNTLALFEPDKTQFDENDKVPSGQRPFKSFTFPSLSYVGNVLVLLAQAKKKEKFTNYGIVESHIEIKNIVNGTFSNTVAEKWKRSVVIQYQNTDSAGGPTAVVSSEKIYVFFFKNLYEAESGNWEYNLISGEVDKREANQIKWGNVVTKPKQHFIDSGVNLGEYILTGSEGSGIFLQESFLIPMEYENKTGPGYFSAIINFSINKDNSWNLVSSTPFAEGMYPAIVEWENKLIMMTSSNEGYRKVYEYNDTGKKWKEVVTSLSGVWGNTKKREPDEYGRQSGFITAKIGEHKNVILFTQTVGDENEDGKYKLHLWVTDYKRVYDAGPISVEVDQNVSSSLLFAQGKLFAAYEKWHEGKSTIYAAHLQKQLEDVTNVLNKWTEQDSFLNESCFADDLTLKSDNTCTDNKISTDGLVGFLSNNYSGDKWVDKYMCVNATVKNNNQNKVTLVNGGLKFSGAGAGAVWSVGAQGQNQQYYFVNHAFTLVAAVTIDGDTTNENTNSILGFNFGKKDSKKTFGLWCTKKDKWEIGENTKKATEKNCDKNKTYQVVLTLNEKNVSVYIDGKTVDGLSQDPIAAEQPLNITYFYFGAETNEKNSQPAPESRVTVRNVLLYNKHFTDEEIRKLKPKQNTNTNPQTPKESTTQNNSSLPNASATKNDTNAHSSSSPPPTTEDSAARVGVVGVLCFMLFGVFTLLGRYVY